MRTRRWRALPPLAGLLLAIACGGGTPPLQGTEAAPETQRTLDSGKVVGFVHPEGGHVWLGIPFAAPPVGALRWRAPQPPEPWEGVRPALAFGPACVQYASPLGGGDGARRGEPSGSEDCLTLNVFAPVVEADAGGSAGLPVMVWIHGGGNSIGDARAYDGARLAQRGQVIVVTVQYRLGVLGWLSHAALHGDADTPEDRSGNYGTLDLIRALEWVQANAAAFGGDPERVTIFGESAGGANVMSLLRSPRARGLFHRAISQSGSVRGASLAEARNLREEGGDAWSSAEVVLALLVARGRAADRAAALELAAGLAPAEVEALLRGAGAHELLRLFDGRFAGMYRQPRLIRDGHVLAAAPGLEPYTRGDSARVPTLLGTNRDENKLFMMFASPHVSRVFGIPYRINDPRRYDLEAEYLALLWKARGADEPATAMAGDERPSVFVYRFDWDDSPKRLWLDMGQLLGAAHGLEIPFVFGRLRIGGGLVFDPDRAALDMALSRAMQSYWARFAATGDPGRGLAGDLPAWQAWAAREPASLVLDSEDDGGVRMSAGSVSTEAVLQQVATDERFQSMAERCAVWAQAVLWSGQLSREGYLEMADGACRAYPLPDEG